MNIEQQVKNVQAGSQEAATALCAAFAPLLKSAAAQPHIRYIYDEALAEASLSFIEAIHNYAADSHVPFAGYAKAKVYGDLRTLFKKERRNWQREISANCAVAEDLELVDTIAAPDPFEKRTVDKILIEAALEKLSPQQKSLLCCLFFGDETQAQAAQRFGTSQQAIAARKKRALQLLRRELATS